jgi:hypothetical protein
MARPKRFELLTPRFVVWGEHFEIARRSASDHDLFRSATAPQNHGPVLDFRGSRFLEQRPALAGGLHWHARSNMPPSRWIAEAGFQGLGRQETGLFFKDSVFRPPLNDGKLRQI